MNCGCRSVGNPGYGSVTTSMAVGRLFIWTLNPSLVISTSAPAVTNFSSAIERCSLFALRTVMSPPVITAATAQVPATIRSATVVCSTAFKLETPVIVSSEVPTPSICAPMANNMLQMSTISGSRAALSITVTPFAVTAAINKVSVAPTLGKSRYTWVPTRPPSGA